MIGNKQQCDIFYHWKQKACTTQQYSEAVYHHNTLSGLQY